MEIKPLKLNGTFEISLSRIDDSRGYFMRTYSQEILAAHKLQTDWVQENESLSIKTHTVRGLHFQMPPHTETKLVRVVQGAVWDVFVDLRRNSETFGQWDAIELSAENNKIVYIPPGFAHGFCTLTENTIMHYKIDKAYAPNFTGGIRWNDPVIGISWNVANPFLSERDSILPFFENFETPFNLEN